MPQILLKLPEVRRRVGLSKVTIYTRIKAGTFPAPVKTGEHSVAWVESEIEQWIEARIAERGATC